MNEAELLAMPESTYMNEDQASFFRERLQRELQAAQGAIESVKADFDAVDTPADETDRATLEEERNLAARNVDRLTDSVNRIKASLARIENGEYGFCTETGSEIGLARLLANPTATMTVEAQTRREQVGRQYSRGYAAQAAA